jgi:hypothetical protein
VDEKARSSDLNGSKHYQNSASSLVPPELKFDLLLPFQEKDLNCATFSEVPISVFMSPFCPAFWESVFLGSLHLRSYNSME